MYLKHSVMSRSNPDKKYDPEYSKVVLGQGFEIGESIKDCYLKKLDIKEKEDRGMKYHTIYLHFLKSGKWITKFINIKPKQLAINYKNERIEAQECLENLMACYLSGHHMKKILTQSYTFGVVGYFNEILEALTEKKFWDIPVNLKTVPDEDGSVHIAKYAPFMSNPKDNRWSLSYTVYEEKKLEKYLLIKK